MNKKVEKKCMIYSMAFHALLANICYDTAKSAWVILSLKMQINC